MKLGSLDINGEREDARRASLFSLIRNMNVMVIFLHETALQIMRQTGRGTGTKIYIFLISHERSNSSGGGYSLLWFFFLPSCATVKNITPG